MYLYPSLPSPPTPARATDATPSLSRATTTLDKPDAPNRPPITRRRSRRLRVNRPDRRFARASPRADVSNRARVLRDRAARVVRVRVDGIVSSVRWVGARLERDVGVMSTPARKRLMRDFKRLQTDPPAGISGTPSESNIMAWHAVIFGPEGTPWEGGTFKLTIAFSEEYPNKAPVVKFVTKMFHPNVYNDGSICLDILQNQWSPIYDVGAILTSIQSLLCDPNPNSPANSEAAALYNENRRAYNKRVAAVVEDSWLEIGAAAR